MIAIAHREEPAPSDGIDDYEGRGDCVGGGGSGGMHGHVHDDDEEGDDYGGGGDEHDHAVI